VIRCQFLKALFGVGRRRHLVAGEAGAGLAGEIAGRLHLPRQRIHVRIKPRVEQHFRLDVLRLAMRFRLGEQAGKAAENLQEGGHGGVMERHAMLFS
jgi:hypothetical protein